MKTPTGDPRKKKTHSSLTKLPQAAQIESSILLIRGHKVMLDRDLAVLYGVQTKDLNKAVKRNRDRFPDDFMFQLSADEAKDWLASRFQTGTMKRGYNLKYLPYAFTQEGVAMLSSVLNSRRAVQVNIEIMRAFVRLRELMATNRELTRKLVELERKFGIHDKQIQSIFEAIRQLMTPPLAPRKEIGFHIKEEGVPYRIKRFKHRMQK